MTVVNQLCCDAWQSYRDFVLEPEEEGDWKSLYAILYRQFFGESPDLAKIRSNEQRLEKAARFCERNAIPVSFYLHTQLHRSSVILKRTKRKADPIQYITPTRSAIRAFNVDVRRHRRTYHGVTVFNDLFLTPLGDLYREFHDAERERTKFAISWVRLFDRASISRHVALNSAREAMRETWDDFAYYSWQGLFEHYRKQSAKANRAYLNACSAFSESLVRTIFRCARYEAFCEALYYVDEHLPSRLHVTSETEAEELAYFCVLSYGPYVRETEEQDEEDWMSSARYV